MLQGELRTKFLKGKGYYTLRFTLNPREGVIMQPEDPRVFWLQLTGEDMIQLDEEFKSLTRLGIVKEHRIREEVPWDMNMAMQAVALMKQKAK